MNYFDSELDQRMARETAEVESWTARCTCGFATCYDCRNGDDEDDADDTLDYEDQGDWDERMSAMIDSWDEVYA